MCVIDAPQLLAVFGQKHSNFSILPTRNHNFFVIDAAQRWSSSLCKHSSSNHVIIDIPKSDSAIVWTRSKSVWNSLRIVEVGNRICVVFTNQLKFHGIISQLVNITLGGWKNRVLWVGIEWVNYPLELNFFIHHKFVALIAKLAKRTIATTCDNRVSIDGLYRCDSFRRNWDDRT